MVKSCSAATNEKKKTGREKISGNVFKMLTSTKPKVDFTKSYSWQSRKSLFFLCQDLSKVRRRERGEASFGTKEGRNTLEARPVCV